VKEYVVIKNVKLEKEKWYWLDGLPFRDIRKPGKHTYDDNQFYKVSNDEYGSSKVTGYHLAIVEDIPQANEIRQRLLFMIEHMNNDDLSAEYLDMCSIFPELNPVENDMKEK